nr:inhibitor of nuclear factor kappa-B kinase subunit beta-like [Hydra vulgaris]
MENGKVYGNWKYEKQIGCGAFAKVSRWKNIKTDKELVVKQCNSVLSVQSRRRWNDEIKLLKRLERHKNLVEERDVPEEIIKALASPENLLGLESCECDLREVLSYTGNCCGLIESMVLKVLEDVACGLNFLHEKNIIHRDLKPENILKGHKGDQVVYKIADFGFAKDLDRSMCKTVLGTQNYMAPELYESQSGYTKAADYWSFGTVIFECITGIRPFDLIKENKLKVICNKSDTEIWGCETPDGVKFYSDIPMPNRLCKSLTSSLKKWLQLVLCHDADKRGTTECFSMIKDILSINEIHLFDIMTCQETSYACKPGDTVQNLKLFIKQEFGIEAYDQYLVKLGSDFLSDQQCLENYVQRTEVVFVFRDNIDATYKINKDMPDRVKELLGHYEEIQKYHELLLKWSHCIYYCTKQSNNYDRLLEGKNALIKILKCRMETIDELKNELTELIIQNETGIHFFNKSLETDIQLYGTDVPQDEWLKAQTEITKSNDDASNLKSLLNDIFNLKSDVEKISVVNGNQFSNELKKIKERAESELYNLSKQKSNKVESNSATMFNIVLEMHSNEKPFIEFYFQLKQVMKTKEKMRNINAALLKKKCALIKFKNSILETQLCRQAKLRESVTPCGSLSCSESSKEPVFKLMMNELNKAYEIPSSFFTTQFDNLIIRFEELFKEDSGSRSPIMNATYRPLVTGYPFVDFSQTSYELESQREAPAEHFVNEPRILNF